MQDNDDAAPVRKSPGPGRTHTSESVARRARQAFVGERFDGELAPSARVRVISVGEVERRLKASKGYLRQKRAIDSEQLLAILLEELVSSGELSRTAGSVQANLRKVRPRSARSIEAAARQVFVDALNRVRREDAPYSALRGRMMLWVGARHSTDGFAINDCLRRVHEEDVDQILDRYEELFATAGVAVSKARLRDFVQTISAALDGMLIRADVDQDDDAWSRRYVRFVMSQIRELAPAGIG